MNRNKSNYIIEYINSIDEDELVERKLDRTELKTKALEYFKLAEDKVKK